ncbi:MAG: PIG-L family deacetylase [Dehalococcoidia bacterium]|nr:PIG-L family deacetylase [Dehalococcoidia bacterium]
MTIQAHPDDQEFTVGGTLAKWAPAGTHIVTVCITSGGAGSNKYTPADMTSAKLVAMREPEQLAACKVLGVAETVFLRYPDGALQHTLELRRDLTRIIRRYKPEVVITGDPTVRFYGSSYLNHPDHRAAADVALDAVFPSAGTRFVFEELLAEGLPPHEVQQVWLHGSQQPDTWIDISGTLGTKLAALQQHTSQLGEWDPSSMLATWAAEQGAAVSLTAAESFRRMILSEG